MSLVGSPLSGQENNRQVTNEDLIRAIGFAAAGEHEATQSYMQLFETIDNKLAAKVLKSVADIKREYMGDFMRLPFEVASDIEKPYALGANEPDEGNQENALGFQGMLDNPTFS